MTEQPKKKEKKCSTTVGGRCDLPARMAISVTRPRGGLATRVYYDIDEAPLVAQPLCKGHGARVVAALINDLVLED